MKFWISLVGIIGIGAIVMICILALLPVRTYAVVNPINPPVLGKIVGSGAVINVYAAKWIRLPHGQVFVTKNGESWWVYPTAERAEPADEKLLVEEWYEQALKGGDNFPEHMVGEAVEPDKSDLAEEE